MVRRRSARIATATAALALGLVGCSGDSGGTGQSSSAAPTSTSASGASGDAVAWAEKICSSVAPEMTALSAGPDVDPSNPQKAQQGLVSYLDTLSSAFDRMIGGIKGAGPAPVPDGDVAAERTVGTLEQAKSSVDKAKNDLAQADVSNPTAFQAAFTKVGQDLQALGELEDPTKDLRGNAELDAAFEQAPSCKQLSGGDDSGATSDTGSATPTTTSTATTS